MQNVFFAQSELFRPNTPVWLFSQFCDFLLSIIFALTVWFSIIQSLPHIFISTATGNIKLGRDHKNLKPITEYTKSRIPLWRTIEISAHLKISETTPQIAPKQREHLKFLRKTKKTQTCINPRTKTNCKKRRLTKKLAAPVARAAPQVCLLLVEYLQRAYWTRSRRSGFPGVSALGCPAA